MTNPILIPQIVQKIFNHLDIDHVYECRMVCQTWYREAIHSLTIRPRFDVYYYSTQVLTQSWVIFPSSNTLSYHVSHYGQHSRVRLIFSLRKISTSKLTSCEKCALLESFDTCSPMKRVLLGENDEIHFHSFRVIAFY